MPRKPTLLPERDSRASAILLQLGSNRLAPTPVRADGRTARLVLDEVASLARRILEDRIGLQTAALEAAPIRREVIERKIEVLAQNPAEAPRHPRGRLSVLRHEAEEHLVQDHLVLEEPRADVVLRCSRQLEVQELRTDVEPFRRQTPDRRPSVRARIPQVSSYHRRLGRPSPTPTASAWSKTLPCSFPETSVFRSVLESDTDTLPRTHTTPDPSPSTAGSAPPSSWTQLLPFIPPRHSHFPATQSSRWEWVAGKRRRRPRGSPAAHALIRQALDSAGRNRQQPRNWHRAPPHRFH